MLDTWARRDLPVLEAVISLLEEHDPRQPVRVTEVARRVGIDVVEVDKALRALNGLYVDYQRDMPGGAEVMSVTPEARRAAGQWPTAEGLIQQLAAGLSIAAGREVDPRKKKKLTAIASELAGAAKEIAIKIASDMLEHRLPR